METSELQIPDRLTGEKSRRKVGSVISATVKSCHVTLSSMGFESTRSGNVRYVNDVFLAVESGHMVYENDVLPSFLQNLLIIQDIEQRLIIRPKGIGFREFISRFSGTIDIHSEIDSMISRFLQDIRDFGYIPYNLWGADIYLDLIGIDFDDMGNFILFIRDPGLVVESTSNESMTTFLQQVEMYLRQAIYSL